MEQSPMTIILVGLVCLVLGFVASLLLNTLRDDSDAPEEGIDQSPPGGRKGRYTVVARLWRERGAGNLVVEMDGRSFIAPDALEPTQRERLENSARELRGWLGMGLEAAPKPPAASLPASDDFNHMVSPPLTAAAQQPQVQQQVRAPAKPYTPPPAAAPAGKASGGKEAMPEPKSMVMQIEDILQDMIAGTPLAVKGVHLTEDPTRGVIVQVGVEYFEGIGAVTDEEIQAVLRQAVQTWEASQ